jgi:hypothetical protein
LGGPLESGSHFIHQEWKMKVKYLITVAAMLVTGAEFADDTYPYVDHSRFTGSKDRAEVEAELASAGPVTSRLHEFVDYTRVTSGKARGEFRAELERAYAGSNYASTRMSEYIDFSQAARTASAAAAVADLIPIPRLAEPRDVPGV